jgi:hypothetical protein
LRRKNKNKYVFNRKLKISRNNKHHPLYRKRPPHLKKHPLPKFGNQPEVEPQRKPLNQTERAGYIYTIPHPGTANRDVTKEIASNGKMLYPNTLDKISPSPQGATG